MKKFFIFLLILLLILGGVGFWGYQKLTSFVHTPVNVTQDQLLTIERGTTGSKLAALLEQENILEHADLLPWLLKLQPQLNKVKAGTYSLTGVENSFVVQLILAGVSLMLTVDAPNSSQVRSIIRMFLPEIEKKAKLRLPLPLAKAHSTLGNGCK